MLVQMKINLELMGQSNNDIKSNNILPSGLTGQIKRAHFLAPSISNPPGQQLCLLGPDGVKAITDHYQRKRDIAIMDNAEKAAQATSMPSSYHNRGQGRDRPRGRG